MPGSGSEGPEMLDLVILPLLPRRPAGLTEVGRPTLGLGTTSVIAGTLDPDPGVGPRPSAALPLPLPFSTSMVPRISLLELSLSGETSFFDRRLCMMNHTINTMRHRPKITLNTMTTAKAGLLSMSEPLPLELEAAPEESPDEEADADDEADAEDNSATFVAVDVEETDADAPDVAADVAEAPVTDARMLDSESDVGAAEAPDKV